MKKGDIVRWRIDKGPRHVGEAFMETIGEGKIIKVGHINIEVKTNVRIGPNSFPTIVKVLKTAII